MGKVKIERRGMLFVGVKLNKERCRRVYEVEDGLHGAINDVTEILEDTLKKQKGDSERNSRASRTSFLTTKNNTIHTTLSSSFTSTAASHRSMSRLSLGGKRNASTPNLHHSFASQQRSDVPPLPPTIPVERTNPYPDGHQDVTSQTYYSPSKPSKRTLKTFFGR